MEYFITYGPYVRIEIGYPICRFPEGYEEQQTKPCFKCAKSPQLIDGEWYYSEDVCHYGECRDDGDYHYDGGCYYFKVSMFCVKVCPYVCITAPCPEIQPCRCSLGKLDEETKGHFEKKIVLHNTFLDEPVIVKLELQSREELGLENVEKLAEHIELMEKFDEIVDFYPNTSHIRFMIECQGLAKKIREARVTIPDSAQPSKSDLTTPVVSVESLLTSLRNKNDLPNQNKEAPKPRAKRSIGEGKYGAIIEAAVEKNIDDIAEGRTQEKITKEKIVLLIRKSPNIGKLPKSDDSIIRAIGRNTVWQERKKKLEEAQWKAGMGQTYENRQMDNAPYQDEVNVNWSE